ncbi:MAG: CPBP family intramembrane glutamic endopeptidase [Peptostreptococcaceae bacterium]
MKRNKKPPNIISALGLACIFLILGQILGVIVNIYLIYSIKLQDIIHIEQNLLYLFCSLVSCIFVIILIVLRIKIIEKRKLSEIKFKKENMIYNYIRGFLIGLLLMSFVVFLLGISGNLIMEPYPNQKVGLNALSNVALISIGWIIQGASEEILTRGWLMRVLQDRYSLRTSVVVSSIFFGALHLLNPNVGIIAIINIILVGFLFSLYVIKTDDLWGVCAMHSAWNLAQGNIYGFEVSGIDVGVGTLLDMDLLGSEIITGGIFGPEAGIATTIILILAIIIFMYFSIFKSKMVK